MKVYTALSAFAFAVLAWAAVWLGGLNQDEGWYLYAAQLVGDGRMPYRDFFYTQGPLMPLVYSVFSWIWKAEGLLGARILTCLLGLASAVVAAFTARLVAREGRKGIAGVVTFMLLGGNLYHVYYTSIPKTYALASLFVSVGFYLLAYAFSRYGRRGAMALFFASGLSLALASGTRISLGTLLAVCGLGLLSAFRSYRFSFLWFGLGGALGLSLVYGPFLLDSAAFAGLCAAQRYHAARAGFDPVFTVGSVSRLVRWYAPLFIVLGLGVAGAICGAGRVGHGRVVAVRRLSLKLMVVGFVSVFVVQMLAPFPYEDYQVPIVGLLAAFAAVLAAERLPGSENGFSVPLLALGLAWACSFGSPLLESWMTNGQDRFWSRKKEKCEMAQLREMARVVEALDPGGKTLLTQDLYLAVETQRTVPDGLEMGPFSMLSDDEWRSLLESAPCRVAALSGYTFAVNPPRCDERPVERQLEFWDMLKKKYELVLKEDDFGQNATTLLVLRKKASN